MHIQCELESQDPNFSFQFYERTFPCKEKIPELRSKNMILHIAQSASPKALPSASKYKKDLSNNNSVLVRQMAFDYDEKPPYGWEPLYGILTFGGKRETFAIVQFPAPGYKEVAHTIAIPNMRVVKENEPNTVEIFERKKAMLREEFMEKEYLKEVNYE